MAVLGQDLRQAWRALAAAPGVAVAAILSLALGIGANTAIFSVASPLLLRPLPYADPERLVILWNRSPGLGITEDWFSTAQYFDIRGSGAFADVAIAIGGNDNLTGGGEPERIGTIRVSSNLLPMLGVRPLLGRLFTADEDRAGAAGTALLAPRHLAAPLRRRRRRRSAASLIVNGVAYRIVGVLPRRLHAAARGDADAGRRRAGRAAAAAAARRRRADDPHPRGLQHPGPADARRRASPRRRRGWTR